MGTMTDHKPCFYKIILDGEPMKRFPPQFMKHIWKDLSDTATLRVASGGLWTVKVKIIGNGVFMEEGWEEFARDNSVKNSDFLLFEYDGNMRFSVKIFDPNGVERIGTSSIRMPQESSGISIGRMPKGRPRKNPVDALNRQYTPLNSSDEIGKRPRKDPVDALNLQYTPLNSSDEGSHTNQKDAYSRDQSLASHKSKKLKTTEKGNNVNANRIESSSKQPKRTTMKPSVEKKKPSFTSKRSHPILLD
ncbi:B3 domain-containing protein At1g49475-like isoform X2 [Mangifera indica]|uniref:B3 domain-containing protein At1g49475-like isoform X2 n=1 Tax=Mangifera indica TaxID=29780 RepID=UPI001CF99787|nr:B3 domain-containing protein At1g49475-like isoform X2 [Mangifera indica]